MSHPVQEHDDKSITGRQVFIWLCCFFGVIIVINVIFVYLATTSFTGVSTEHAYNKGLAYNEVLAQGERQKALGWKVDVTEARITEPGKVRVAVSYADREATPLTGLAVVARMVRPSAEGHDFEIVLTPEGDGVYGGEADLPLQGRWDMTIEATGPGLAQPYVLIEQLFLTDNG